MSEDRIGDARAMDRAGIQALFDVLRADGMPIVGPTVRDGAIVLDVLESPDALPIGWTDLQAPGKYRLARRDDDALFGYVNGPGSWKQELFPARETLYRAARRADGRVGFEPVVPAPAPRAFLGVRACDLAAIHVQDRTFVDAAFQDPRYAARRASAFVIAVSCTRAGPLCFCTSMGTGPRVGQGADLVLTELGGVLLVEVGSERGARVADRLPLRDASEAEIAARDDGLSRAASEMGRAMDTRGLPELLFGNLEHPRWDDVASRCLSCGNCTQVCPTCFCSGVEETSDLDGAHAERTRVWESCFTQQHGAIHGLDPRPTILDRYRQWMTHKLGSWVSQFGVSGCVGCGRCIAWCPVGIDITEEVAAIRASPAPPVPMPAAPAAIVSRPEDTVPREARVIAAHRESADTMTLELELDGIAEHAPGQFLMLALPAIGEAAISISGGCAPRVEHTIRAVGAVSSALCALEPGTHLGARGPYGRGWPLDEAHGRDVMVIAGGIGLAPLRSAVRALRDEGRSRVRVLYGARTPADRIYVDELDAWSREGVDVAVTVDRAGPGWRGHVGFVTRLLRWFPLPADGLYLICGPEIMARSTVGALSSAGVPDTRIYTSNERHMKCAAGFCGRCQYGPYFVCKDGPVFRMDELRLLFGRDGF